MFHIFSNLFSFPISNSRAFPVTFFPLVLSPGPRSGFLHLHRYSYYVASYALFLHPWKQINHCFLYSLFRFFLLFKKQLDKRLCFDYQNKLSYKAAQQPALIFTPVFDTAELGRTDMQSSFLLHLTNHGIRKGFSRLYMTSGEGDARPVPFFRSITTTRLPSQIMHIFVNSTVSVLAIMLKLLHQKSKTDLQCSPPRTLLSPFDTWLLRGYGHAR